MARGSGNGWVSKKKGKTIYRWYDDTGAERSKVIGPEGMCRDEALIRVGSLGLDKLAAKPVQHQYKLGELAARYLNYGKTKSGVDKAHSTLDLEKQLVRDYVTDQFGGRVAVEIEPLEIQCHLDGISKGVRPKVLQLALGDLQALAEDGLDSSQRGMQPN